MAEQLIKKNLSFIKILPTWAQELSYRYCSKTANLYLLHGNIRDFLPHKMNEGEFIFVRIQEYISEVLFGNRDIIVYFDRSSGLTFCKQAMQDRYLDTMEDQFPDDNFDDFLSSNPEKAFFYLEKYFLLNIPFQKRIVLIIDYAETLIPGAEIVRLSEEDRYCMVTLNRWAHNPVFTHGDVSVLLLTENLADLSPRLVSSPSTVKVEIPFPDTLLRASFLEFLRGKDKLLLETGISPQNLAENTSGLNLMNLNHLAAESFQEEKPIALDYLRRKKKEIIENEAGGLLEFIETQFNLSLVSGHEFVKRRLQHAAKAIKQGRYNVLPMGYLIAGPVGTGKSYMVTAFAGEIGIPIVRLKNIRSKWQGVTESNLEKVFNILKAMSPVGVMIDEADAMLGNRNQTGDSGTSNRIFAQIAAFMGNTEYRGKVIWFLITCRPDLIPIDLKRQGRAEEHLALFYPQNNADKEALFETLKRKLNIKIRADVDINDLLKKYPHDVSGADIEAIMIRAGFRASMEKREFITNDDMKDTLADFVPPTYPHEIDLQNLVAVLECTSREMVPKKYQNIDRTNLLNQIQEIKMLLGERR